MRMHFSRRQLLHLLASQLVLAGTGLPAAAQAPVDALFLVIDGIGPNTPPTALEAFLAPILAGDFPLALVLRAEEAQAGLPAPLAASLTAILARPQVEAVPFLPGLAGLSPYFQRRAASQAMDRLAGILPDLPLSVATQADEIAGTATFDALRALGLRGVLTLGARPPMLSTGCASLAVCLQGETGLAIAVTPDPAAAIASALARPGWAQIVLALDGLEQLSPAETRLRGARAADGLSRELARGRRFLALPRDHALWFGTDQKRLVALRLDAAGPADRAAQATFVARLGALGIPFSQTVGPADTGPWPAGACLDPAAQSAPDPAAAPGGDAPLCHVGDPVDRAVPELVLVPDNRAAFDDRGLLIRGETPISAAAALIQPAGLMRDALLSVAPADYRTPAALEATLATLAALHDDAGTRMLDLPGFVAASVTPDPVLDLLRDSRRLAVEPEAPDPLSAADWLSDAQQAWTFFQRFSDAKTGLCVDTADVQGDETWLHGQLTMWDLGSLFAAVLAAHELGLLPDAEFLARAEVLVAALPVERIAGLRLPAEVISTDTGRVLSGDFNACDTGRLLSVLRELDAYPLTRGLAEDTVARWDLAGVIRDGRVHSVVNGALVDRSGSHCAHYTARAWRDRGFEVVSPYEQQSAGSPTDDAMRLLQSLGGLGALGAEPLLFEALEMGLSPPSELLASILLAAQRRDFQRTGQLACVSESPLNRAPWFMYQGLNLTATGDRWLTTVASDDAEYATPAFRRETELVNTKAAYLWAACRPGAYSTRLVRHVRTLARLEGIGFSPGVFVASGTGMPGYADVNTNAVVLEAIAFILRGRKPRTR